MTNHKRLETTCKNDPVLEAYLAMWQGGMITKKEFVRKAALQTGLTQDEVRMELPKVVITER